MVYTTGTTITFKKVVVKGSPAITPTAANQYSVTIVNSAGTRLFNPTTVTVVQPTAIVDGSITIAGVPLVNGINNIAVTSQDNADLDVGTVAMTTVGKAAVYKVESATAVVV